MVTKTIDDTVTSPISEEILSLACITLSGAAGAAAGAMIGIGTTYKLLGGVQPSHPNLFAGVATIAAITGAVPGFLAGAGFGLYQASTRYEQQ